MESPAAVNDDFNLSTAASTTVLELAEAIWHKIHTDGRPFRFVSDPPFEHDVQLRVPDVRKSREVLGFEATTTLDQMLVVYDFDEDPTVPVIDRIAAELPTVRGLRNDLGRGVLNAMKAGLAASSGAYVLISMADGSDEPHVVDSLVVLARDGADVVSASRYMRGGRQIGGPPLKRLMSRTAGLTLHWFAGVPTHDPTNNFKLYSRRYLDSVTIESSAGFELAL